MGYHCFYREFICRPYHICRIVIAPQLYHSRVCVHVLFIFDIIIHTSFQIRIQHSNNAAPHSSSLCFRKYVSILKRSLKLTALSATVLLIFAHYSDKTKLRSPFILLGLTMCLIGFSINISNASHGVKYFGTFFCIAGSYAAFPGIVTWYLFLFCLVRIHLIISKAWQ